MKAEIRSQSVQSKKASSYQKSSCNEDFLPFHIPNIEEEEIQEVVDTLRSGWLTTGPKAKRFEAEFRSYINCKHALALNSGTAALHLALESIGLKQGDLVVVPTLTFTATAAVICYFGAIPVMADVNSEDYNVGADQIDAVFHSLGSESAKIKAIIPVHFCGYACEMDEILDISSPRGIKIISDAAHAIPCQYKGKNVGVIGDMTAFSFYANKNITTGEGGMLTTGSDNWAERVKIMRLHGMSKDAWRRYEAMAPWYYEVIACGYKYNLTDIAAAIGIHQLKKSDSFHRRRRYIASVYAKSFSESDAIMLPRAYTPCIGDSENSARHAWHLFPILIDPDAFKINRDQFIDELAKRNIGASVHFIPLHLHKFYQNTFKYRNGDFPVSEFFFKHCISLPIYPKMTNKDIDHVVSAVFDVIQKFRK